MRFETLVMPEVQRALGQYSLPAYTGNTKLLVSTLRHASALGAAAVVLADIFEVPGHYYV